MKILLLIGLSGFVFSIVFTPLVRRMCRRLGVLDHPDAKRKLHGRAVPRVGGIAIAIAYVAALALRPESLPLAGRLFPAAALIFAAGLIDDVRGLKPWQKLAAQLIAGFAAWQAGVQITGIHGHPMGIWSLPVTLLWLVGCSNALNLIDGVDGLAAGVGLFATVTSLLAALLQNNMELAMVTVPLAGALLGFLRYNFNPASIFLGDCGSLLIGFLLGCYGVLWSQKSATLLGMTAPLMALAIPLLDTGLSILRRFLRNQPIFAADRGHIHHRLLDRGLPPRHAVLLIYALCGVAAVFSLCMLNHNIAGIVIVLFCAGAWMGIQHLGYPEFGIAGRLFVNGAFRRLLHTQILLRTFEDSLAGAETPDECWRAIHASYREFGFQRVHLHLAGRHYQDSDRCAPGNCWTVRIPLSSSDYVNVTREFGEEAQRTIVAPFADVLRNTLGAKLAARAKAPQPRPVALRAMSG